MHNLFNVIAEQRRQLKTLFFINVTITAIIYGLLLYFSIHVINQPDVDPVSISLGAFFIVISIFSLIQIIFGIFLFNKLNRKSDEFMGNIKDFINDNNIVVEDLNKISPKEFYNVAVNATSEEDLIQKIEDLIKNQ